MSRTARRLLALTATAVLSTSLLTACSFGGGTSNNLPAESSPLDVASPVVPVEPSGASSE